MVSEFSHLRSLVEKQFELEFDASNGHVSSMRAGKCHSLRKKGGECHEIGSLLETFGFHRQWGGRPIRISGGRAQGDPARCVKQCPPSYPCCPLTRATPYRCCKESRLIDKASNQTKIAIVLSPEMFYTNVVEFQDRIASVKMYIGVDPSGAVSECRADNDPLCEAWKQKNSGNSKYAFEARYILVFSRGS